jgi:glycosyltransferase involved in cell wall biosynthesis
MAAGRSDAMNVMLVDPSLYTAPYDAALTRGLLVAGLHPVWMTRPLRRGDRQEIPIEHTQPFFYRRTDQARWVPVRLRPFLKGCAHLAGMAKLLWKVRREKPDVVHMQWIVVPLVDVLAMALIRRWCPLLLTVHDTVPYNGEKMSWMQRLGHELPPKLAHLVIVHTRSGTQALRRSGIQEARVCVIPHGPLRLSACAPPASRCDGRWAAVLFGEIKPYKGLDVLIEAVAALPAGVRERLRVVVAGRPRMEIAPLAARIASLGLAGQFELRLGRLSEEQMAALFAEADGFVFPYRQVDASGVYYLVKSLGKWLIASRVGVFAEEMAGEGQGTLVTPGDVPALARALQHAIEQHPAGGRMRVPDTSWSDIGRATRALYERAQGEFATLRPRHAWRR